MSKRTHTTTTDGVVTAEFPFTFREDLLADLDDEWRPFIAAAFPGGMPSTIEEYDSRFDPRAATIHSLVAAGLSQGEINTLPPPFLAAMAVFTKIALQAVFKNHSKVPGIDSDTMDSP